MNSPLDTFCKTFLGSSMYFMGMFFPVSENKKKELNPCYKNCEYVIDPSKCLFKKITSDIKNASNFLSSRDSFDLKNYRVVGCGYGRCQSIIPRNLSEELLQDFMLKD